MQMYLLAWAVAADREREIRQAVRRQALVRLLARPGIRSTIARAVRHILGLQKSPTPRPISRPFVQPTPTREAQP